MLNYILNISKIVQNFPDNSDYEYFYSHCVIYIKNNVNQHENIKNELLQAIRIFTNETLISIAYRLLNKLSLKYTIDAIHVKQHLESEYLTNEVFFYIAQNDISEYDDVIYKKLYDKDYISKGMIEILKLERNKNMLIEFLDNKNETYFTKQIDLMIASELIMNTYYYVQKIGSDQKNICFKVFELLYFIVSIDYEDEWLLVKKNIIKFKKRINVQSANNFFFFVFDFFEFKHDLLVNYERNNQDYIKNVLNEYITNTDTIQLTDRQLSILKESLSDKKPKKELELDEQNIETLNFDYLFTNEHYKACIDCLEI
ncbi:hypothetical protein BDAP_001439 [Binucleata daphniae]